MAIRAILDASNKAAVYATIIEKVFFDRYKKGARLIEFSRDDLLQAAAALELPVPKNIGDVVYSFRYRRPLPGTILATAVGGGKWSIFPAGTSRYRFELGSESTIEPRSDLQQIKLLDATPQIIARYALGDEQALLAIVRYNRLIDLFAGVTAYSLQNHLRTSVPGIGQIEIDELYVGLNKRGTHFVLPVQAKGGRDRLGAIQVFQDLAFCRAQYPSLLPRSIAVQFLRDGGIAMFEVAMEGRLAKVIDEKHYRLVAKDDLSDAELATIRSRS